MLNYLDSKTSYDMLTENWIFPQENLEINMESWTPGNPLWITGSSGDGKSTLAKEISQKYNAIIITSDVVLCRIRWSREKFNEALMGKRAAELEAYGIELKDSPALDYVMEHPDLPYSMRDPDDVSSEMVKFYAWLMRELSTNQKYKRKLYLVEGCNICALDPNIMATKPLIIVGGARLRSLFRRAKRDAAEKDRPLIKSIFKYIKKYELQNRGLDDDKDSFRKGVTKALHNFESTGNVFDDILIIEDKTFDLSVYKAICIQESAYDLLGISIVESVGQPELIEESFSDFAHKVHMAIIKILDALKRFLMDLKVKIDTKIQQSGINKKLMDLKKALAEKKAKLLEKCSYYDIQEYMSYYSKFIKAYTAEVKEGLNKDFKTEAEYDAWRERMSDKMSQFKDTLSNEEKWKLMQSVDKSLKYTEKEFQNRKGNLKIIEDIGNASIKEIDEGVGRKFGFDIHLKSYKPVEMQIFKKKRSFIGHVCSQIAMCVRTVAKFVSKHVFLCLTAIVVAIAA